jgi:hypothetical protein
MLSECLNNEVLATRSESNDPNVLVFGAGVEREEAQSKRLATVARAVGVEHYVYTSVGSADKQTGVPHFDNKPG